MGLESLIAMLQPGESLIEEGEIILGIIGDHLILLEELESVVEAHFLTCVHHRHTGESKAKHGESANSLGITVELSTFPRIEVMVGDHIHVDRSYGILLGLLVDKCGDIDSGLNGAILLVVDSPLIDALGCGDGVEEVLHRPCIIDIEGLGEEFRFGGFSEHQNRFDGLQLRADLLPEIGKDFTGDVATITVDISLLNPEEEGFSHSCACSGVVIIEHEDISPVVRAIHIALLIASIIIGMFFYPGVVGTGMVADLIEDYSDAESVSGIYESLKIGECTKLRVDLHIILHGIVRAESTLTLLKADGMDRHKPDYIDAELTEAREFLAEAIKVARGCTLAEISLIDYSRLEPSGRGRRSLNDRLLLSSGKAGKAESRG